MYVADLELCKELYELSGWDKTDYVYCKVNGDTKVVNMRWITERGLEYPEFPAYDLGYLLRKLPSDISESEFTSAYLHLTKFNLGEQYSIYYQVGASKPKIEVSADTPENATAKLAIELLKQGILKKEGA